MRVGIVADPWVPVPPLAYGGTEIIIDIEARAFVAAGHDVLLYTVGQSTCPVPKKWVIDNPSGLEIGNIWDALQHVMHAYEDLADYDIVHDHTIAGLIYSERWPHLPVVTTQHGPFDTVRSELYRSVSNRVPIIAISHSQAKSAPSGLNIARIIHHGIDASQFPIGEGTGDDRGEYFLNLSRMTAEKGIKEAVLAAKEAGVRLLIASKMREAREREYFETHVRHLLDDKIQYVGEVGFAEKCELLANAKALLNPIQWEEPFGLTMIEALACATPVIATRRGAAPEIIDHGLTGFLCDNMSDVTTALGKVDRIDRADCRAAVEGYFSSTRMADDHLEFFDDLMRGNTRRNITVIA